MAASGGCVATCFTVSALPREAGGVSCFSVLYIAFSRFSAVSAFSAFSPFWVFSGISAFSAAWRGSADGRPVRLGGRLARLSASTTMRPLRTCSWLRATPKMLQRCCNNVALVGRCALVLLLPKATPNAPSAVRIRQPSRHGTRAFVCRVLTRYGLADASQIGAKLPGLPDC